MNRLRKIRESKNLSLKKTTELLKNDNLLTLTPDALAKYERGDRQPTAKTWQALADFFNVSVDYLKGYGYSKEYIYKCLDDAYKENYSLTFDLEPPFTNVAIFARDEIEEYCENKKINIPENVDLEFWQKYFNFIFKDKSVKRLLTTKDNYSDSDIKDLLIEAISWYGTDPRTKAIVNHIKHNN